MTKAERTREFIIEKAAPIFNTKGYAGTSLNDLIEVTGLTKGSIYGNFENKDEVAIAVYEHNIKRFAGKLDEACVGKKSASDKLVAITEYYKRNWQTISQRGGCPFLNASVEADDNLPFLRKHVQNSIKAWSLRFSKIIDEGVKQGEFKKAIPSNEYAYAIIALLEGGIMLAKIENTPKHLFAATDRIVKLIKEELKK
jgi:TetR/AcrR family transcriptional repressor of nem operon